MKQVAICLLNYNGTADTIDCIRSIYRFEPYLDCRVLVLDNDSRPEERELLVHAVQLVCSEFGKTCMIQPIESDSLFVHVDCDPYDCLVFNCPTNIGFARGNNWLCRLAMEFGAEYLILLNNDTVLVEDSITRLVKAYEEADDDRCAIASTDIHYFAEPDKCWNAGGRILFGTRRYYLDDDVAAFLRSGEHFPKASFITGCFMLIPRKTAESVGLLTERFFFGEEDYEYALRLRDRGMYGRVLLDTHILHKVGTSIARASGTSMAKGFVHHLNRVIDMRSHYPSATFFLWEVTSLLHAALFVRSRYSIPLRGALCYASNIAFLSRVLDGVSKETFEALLSASVEELCSREGLASVTSMYDGGDR